MSFSRATLASCHLYVTLSKKWILVKSLKAFIISGWVIRIRTLIDGVRVRSPAVGRSPRKIVIGFYTSGLLYSQEISMLKIC